MHLHIPESNFEIINRRRIQNRMSNSDAADDMPCEAAWADVMVDTDAVVPRYEPAEMLKNLMLPLDDAGADEMLINNEGDEYEGDDMEQLCGCAQCEAAIHNFYPDYLGMVKRLSASEIDHKTRSIRRTTSMGYHLIQGFIDALWSTTATVTGDGDHLYDVWGVIQAAYFCDSQLAIWKNQLVARKIIRG